MIEVLELKLYVYKHCKGKDFGQGKCTNIEIEQNSKDDMCTCALS